MAGFVGEQDWTAAMRAGEFARAWAISDAALHKHRGAGVPKHSGPRHLQRIWQGEDLRGQHVLVRCYHGLGDTIQFIRFVMPLSVIAREVTIWCQPELVSLVCEVDGVDRVIALHDGTPDLDYDVDIEIMELPHALYATSDMVSMRRPYLKRPSPVMLNGLGQDLTSIGLVWEVGNWDKRRSVPAPLLAQLSGLKALQLFSLQRGAAAAAAERIPAIDISTPDLDTLASIIGQLDLVISVDTMVAHLAGALGTEVWTMLHAECDWRWPLQGNESIWYPSMRLFHQTHPGDWSGVVEAIIAALAVRRNTNDLRLPIFG